MDSYDKKYTADFFKKDLLCESNKLQPQTHEDFQEANETSSKGELSTDEEVISEDETSTDLETSSEDEVEEEFKNEDKLISRLYREVVDDLMASNNLRESAVNAAIVGMKQEIYQGHRKQFRRFAGIDFCKPVNCCGYLRRYAICHTGLVKKIMWKFLHCEKTHCKHAIEEIVNASHLKVVALGGGPGNDLVGFCCALQEIPNSVEKLDLIVVDINKGWNPVFPKLLVKAKMADYGSLSLCLNKTIRTGFMAADLTDDEDERLSNLLGQSDVLLMVKVTSFIRSEDSDVLINNVVDSMKPGAMLIFIDNPCDTQFFRETKSVDCIYHNYTKHELCFNPSKSQSPAIPSCQAHVAILKKKLILTEDSSESEEA